MLPDCGTSVYPVTRISDPLSDVSILLRIKQNIESRFKAEKKPLAAGFSAGVEGAIKFSLLSGISEIIAISGNYDLRMLPAGEKDFHERVYGKNPEITEKENPVMLLRNSNTTLYLFCEEKNKVNVQQAQTLVDAKIPGVKIIDLRALGNGYSHDWTFLTSPGITENFEKIISGSF